MALPAVASSFSVEQGQWWSASASTSRSAAGPELSVVGQGHDYVDLRLRVSGLQLAEGTGDAAGYTKVSLPGEGVLEAVGLPELPVVGRFVAMPEGATPRVEILEEKVVSRAISRVYPAQVPMNRCFTEHAAFSVSQSAYEAGGLYPSAAPTVGSVSSVRGQSFARVELHPVRYDAAAGQLRVATEMTVRVHYGTPYQVSRSLEATSPVVRALQSNLVGLRDTLRAERDQAYKESMLVVLGSDSFKASLKEFIAWKERRGINVIVKSVKELGSDANALRNGIKKVYSEHKDLTYLLLVGDERSIPAFSKRYKSAAGSEASQEDYKFGQIGGTGEQGQIFVGRLLASSAAHVSTQVNRVLTYEKKLGNGSGDLSWLKKGIGIASSEGAKSGQTDIQRVDVIEKAWRSAGFGAVDRVSEGRRNKPNITQAVNQGRGWIAYLGHGSGSAWAFSSDRWSYGVRNIRNTKNADKWPIVMDCSCLNGAYHKLSPSFDEMWVQHGSAASPFGGLASVASTISADWVPPAIMMDAMAKHSLDKKKYKSLGELYIEAVNVMMSKVKTSGTKTRDTYVVLGDPSMGIRNDIPAKVEITAKGEKSSVQVTASKKGGAAAFPAVVALSKDNELVVAGRTDSKGAVTLELPKDLDAEELDIVVTGLNLAAAEGKVKLDGSGSGKGEEDDDNSSSDDDTSSSSTEEDDDSSSSTGSEDDPSSSSTKEVGSGDDDDSKEDDDDKSKEEDDDSDSEEDNDSSTDDDDESSDEDDDPKQGGKKVVRVRRCSVDPNSTLAGSLPGMGLALFGLVMFRRRLRS